MQTSPAPGQPRNHPRSLPLFVSGLLFLLVLLVFLPCLQNSFVNIDDGVFVYQNSHVQQGLKPATVRWALTTWTEGFWHPLTWLSLALDYHIYGLRAWGFHLTNLLLHALNSVLLFRLWHRLTGRLWPSAFVALFFGLHPLHVESVAWVSERKDLLGTCFGILSLLLYARYVQASAGQDLGCDAAPGPRTDLRSSKHTSHLTFPASRYYLLSLACFVCGLMSKTMIVTLPLLLLLLDYWPLRRLARDGAGVQFISFRALLREKVPFLTSALGFGVLTLYSQKAAGAVVATAQFPLTARIANAVFSGLRYLALALWPVDLAVFYPFPSMLSLPLALLGAALLLLLSLGLLWPRRTRPYLAAGWLWYLITLLPILGFIQVGGQSHADRYTYLPLIGISVLLTWSATDLVARWHTGARGVFAGGIVVSLLFLAMTRQQLTFWKNSESLFRHALAVTSGNALAHNNLGGELLAQQRFSEAVTELAKALQIAPDRAEVRLNLGLALGRQGRLEDALRELTEAVRLAPGSAGAHSGLAEMLATKGDLAAAIQQYAAAARLAPDDPEAHFNLGVLLNLKDCPREAAAQFQQALRLRPTFAAAHRHLGVALGKQGLLDQAISQFEQALAAAPTDAEARCALGDALLAKGETAPAIVQYQAAVRSAPGNAVAHHNLGVALGMAGRTADAVNQFRQAVELDPRYPEAHCNLGVALFEQGQPEDAVAHLKQALRLAPRSVEIRCHWGATLLRLGQREAGLEQLREALRLQPDSPEAKALLDRAGEAGPFNSLPPAR